MTTLEKLSGLVVIDEVQHRPDLFELVRVLVDRPENRTRFLLLGSSSCSLRSLQLAFEIQSTVGVEVLPVVSRGWTTGR